MDEVALAKESWAGNETGPLLVGAVQGRRIEPPASPNVALDLLKAAEYHGVVLALRRAYGPAQGQARIDELSAAAHRLRAQALRIAHAAVQVSNWLDAATVRHAVVKGPAIAAAYANSDREFDDLDILVAPRDMVRAIRELERHGAEVLADGGWPRGDGIGELVLGLPSGVAVDLHADLIHHEEVRRQFRFPAEPLLHRTTTTAVLGQGISVLDPDDSATYLALHAAVSGGDRLVWLADLDALVRHDEIQWQRLIDRARDARLALVVGVMFQRASRVLETPIPPGALSALLRDGFLWSKMLAAFERQRPIASNYGKIFRGQVLMRSTRHSTASSVVALAGLLWTDVIRYVFRDASHPWRVRVRVLRRGLTTRER